MDSVQKPINLLFLGGGLCWAVVGHLAANFLEQVDMFDDACPIDVSKLSNGFLERTMTFF